MAEIHGITLFTYANSSFRKQKSGCSSCFGASPFHSLKKVSPAQLAKASVPIDDFFALATTKKCFLLLLRVRVTALRDERSATGATVLVRSFIRILDSSLSPWHGICARAV